MCWAFACSLLRPLSRLAFKLPFPGSIEPSGFSFRSASGRHWHQDRFSSHQHKSSGSGEQPFEPAPPSHAPPALSSPSHAPPPLPPPSYPSPPTPAALRRSSLPQQGSPFPTGPQVPWSGNQTSPGYLSGLTGGCGFLLGLVSAWSPCHMVALSALPAPLKPVPY